MIATLLATLVALCLAKIKIVQIESSPSYIGAQKATLSVSFMTDTAVTAGSFFRVTVPDGTSIVNGSLICAVSGFNQQDNIACQAQDSNALWFPFKTDLLPNSYNTYLFKSVFQTPANTGLTPSFKIEIFASDKITVTDSVTSGIFLKGTTPATLPSNFAIVKQVDSGVVGAYSQMYFTLTTLNPIPAGGGVKIDFPKWDPLSNRAFLSYIDQAANCSVKMNVDAGLNCTFVITTSQDSIVVQNSFPKGLAAGQTFSFYVSTVRNPLSMSPIQLQISTFSALESQNGQVKGLIDTSAVKLQASTPAKMDPALCSVNSGSQTVSNFTDFEIKFQSPVAIQDGCIILITVPIEDFQASQFGNLGLFWGWGIFGVKQRLNAAIDDRLGTIKIVDQCQQYSTADQTETTIILSQLQNPYIVKKTSSFKIAILDSNSQLIAQITSGISYQTTPGQINQVSLSPIQLNDIQAVTDVALSFTPTHSLTPQSHIVVRMSSDLLVYCKLSGTSGIQSSTTCVQQTDGSLKFSKLFPQNYPGNLPLQITFKDLILPSSSRPVTGLQIETYQQDGSNFYLVDKLQVEPSTQYFIPNSVMFLQSKIDTGLKVTYTETAFTFSFTLASFVPFNSIMYATIPSQVIIANSTTAASQCKSIRQLQMSLVCSITSQDDGSHLLQISNAFGPQGLPILAEIIFSIKSGLKTPISKETTDTFTMRIVDMNNFEINYINSTLSITMSEAIDIGPTDVTYGNETVGALTTHRLLFNTPVPLVDNFHIYVVIPIQCTPPQPTDLVCRIEAPFSKILPCRLNGDRITIDVITLPGFNIIQDDVVIITIGPIYNPASMKPSDPYDISIRSDTWYEVARQATTGASVIMRLPSQISDFQFKLLDQRQLSYTSIIITWISTQIYPPDVSLLITYNPIQMYPGKLTSQTLPCIINLTQISTCNFASQNQIIVNKILPTTQPSGQPMELTITNMFVNIQIPVVTDSWTLTTLTQGRYVIDTIQSGMKVTFKCSYPCLTCDPSSPDVCLSCNTVADIAILYNGKCYKECPSGSYFEFFQCKPCDKKCKTCTQTSGIQCTSCDSSSPDFPYLTGNTCSKTCDFSFYGNKDTAKCEACQYPCESCVGTSRTCTTCPQLSVERFWYKNDCISQCPSGYVAPIIETSNICKPCIGCATCQGQQNNCVSCQPLQYLNKYDNTCVNKCPFGTTVPVNGTCEVCDTKCKTCNNTTEFCTSCQSTLTLNDKEGTCVLHCDLNDKTKVSVNGVCWMCSDKCGTCQDLPDYCLSCPAGKFLYANTCVTKCPTKDDYQYEPNEDNICVIPGLICRFGYKVTPAGNGCEIKAQVCDDNYKLNYDKDKCIPVSPGYVPLPFFAAMLFMMVVPIVSKVRNRESKIVANFIIFISVLEPIGMLVLFIEAIQYGIKPVTYLAGLALIFHFATNFFFCLIYTKQVKNDQSFKHWQVVNQKVSLAVMILGLLNFKIFRLFYSRLLGHDEFNAPLEQPMVFYRPFNMCSLFTLVMVVLPIMVASGFGLIYVNWGYQLLVTCVEMEIIMFTLLVLQIIEYCQYRFENKKLYKVGRKQVDIKVQSGYMSDSSEDEILNQKKIHKPKALKQMKVLTRINNKIKANLIKNGGDVEKEISELHEIEIMQRQLRHCKSFKQLRPSLHEIWGSESEREEFQDFISEPASPRSKEMLHNGRFVDRMHQLHNVYKMRDQYDNCYAEIAKKGPNKKKIVEQQSVKVQTNVLELLGVDDLTMVERSSQGESTELQRRLTREREKEIPNFQLKDILGDFAQDEKDVFLIILNRAKLWDKKHRQVNRMGYTVDSKGNVITKSGVFLFYREELDPNTDELPPPYCDNVYQNQKFRVEKGELKKAMVVEEQENDESLETEEIVVEEKEVEEEARPNDDEEEFIKALTKPKKAKTKKELMAISKAGKPYSAKVKQTDELSAEVFNPISQATVRQSRGSDLRSGSRRSIETTQPMDNISMREQQLQEVQQMKGLVFAGTKKVGGAYSQIRKNMTKMPHFVAGKQMLDVYEKDLKKIDQHMYNMKVESQFLKNLESQNEDAYNKRTEYLRQVAKETQGAIRQGYLPTESVQDHGLARKNLNSIYGRVRTKFNSQIRQGGAALKFNKRPADNDRMHELEEIYLNPRVDNKLDLGSTNVSNQIREIRHLIDVPSQSLLRSQSSQVNSAHFTGRK